MQRSSLILLVLLLWPFGLWAQAYSETGLPLPRFVSLKSSEVNMRKGPGTRYPIFWIYHKDGLPLEIINEFGHWRQVRDHQNVVGWMHKSMLSSRRTVMIVNTAQPLRADPDEESTPLLMLQPDVIADIAECNANWCELQVKGRKGWIPKADLWGVYPQEIME